MLYKALPRPSPRQGLFSITGKCVQDILSLPNPPKRSIIAFLVSFRLVAPCSGNQAFFCKMISGAVP
ncbi:MAG: hypothetical protein A2512_11315 [Deltaproteobacteria bacterium RIFOXYD12_FULL_56_24]|nr:MAG: hypothetical protein A2512_11315 [Deltaproteobacteria bacterium RIFOXYD12_FULL_56_24]